MNRHGIRVEFQYSASGEEHELANDEIEIFPDIMDESRTVIAINDIMAYDNGDGDPVSTVTISLSPAQVLAWVKQLSPAPAVDAEAIIDAVTTYASFAQAFGICSSSKSEFSRPYQQANTDRDAARDAAFTAIRAALRPAAVPPEGQGERAAEQLREIIERIDAFGADITGAYPSIHPGETGWSTILAGLITDLEALAAAPPLKRDDAEMAVAVLRRVLGAHGEHMNAAADPDTPPGTVKYLYNRIDDVFMEAWDWLEKHDNAAAPPLTGDDADVPTNDLMDLVDDLVMLWTGFHPLPPRSQSIIARWREGGTLRESRLRDSRGGR